MPNQPVRDVWNRQPWSEAFIDRYAERWNWGEWGEYGLLSGLSKNAGLPWSHTLYDRFADRWDVDGVFWHYDGNIRSLKPEQVDRLMHDLF